MGDIKIGRIPLGSYMTNCYFLYREGSSLAIVVDPADAGERIYDALLQKGFEVKAILLTHGHFDHIYGCAGLKKASGAKIYAYKEEDELLRSSELNLSGRMGRIATVESDELFYDGQECSLCDMDFKVIHTPGHTVGSACFYFAEAGILVAGDTLFAESIGRSDFPTGNGNTLISSIKTKLMELPDETRVFPGHGERTTIGWERENNPFL